MKRIALLLAVLAFPTVTRAADDEVLRKLDHDNTVATWTADARWFEQNLADDFVIVTANGLVKTKQDVLKDLAATDFAMEPYEPTEVQVRVYGDTGIVTGRVVQKFVRQEQHYAFEARYTDVYVRRRSTAL